MSKHDLRPKCFVISELNIWHSSHLRICVRCWLQRWAAWMLQSNRLRCDKLLPQLLLPLLPLLLPLLQVRYKLMTWPQQMVGIGINRAYQRISMEFNVYCINDPMDPWNTARSGPPDCHTLVLVGYLHNCSYQFRFISKGPKVDFYIRKDPYSKITVVTDFQVLPPQHLGSHLWMWTALWCPKDQRGLGEHGSGVWGHGNFSVVKKWWCTDWHWVIWIDLIDLV